MKSDTQLQLDVIAELRWDASIDSSEIGVEVKDGIVTLAGHAANYAEKWGAERAAQRVTGVKALAVEMDVKLAGFNVRSDADVAHAAQNVLQWLTALPPDSVKVMVEGGWVTLSGEVDWDFQRLAAMAAVSNLMGVTGVSDQIAIKTIVSSDSVKREIEASLKRRAKSDGQSIVVDVVGDRVTLSGTVHSWSERDLAKHSAWGTTGVRYVVDNLTVAS
jgi:osmotically-inducible protein OsmY